MYKEIKEKFNNTNKEIVSLENKLKDLRLKSQELKKQYKLHKHLSEKVSIVLVQSKLLDELKKNNDVFVSEPIIKVKLKFEAKYTESGKRIGEWELKKVLPKKEYFGKEFPVDGVEPELYIDQIVEFDVVVEEYLDESDWGSNPEYTGVVYVKTKACICYNKNSDFQLDAKSSDMRKIAYSIIAKSF